MCAERIALYTAATQHPGKSVKKLAVVAHKKNHKELSAASSCGACRQVMVEFEERQKEPLGVIMLGAKKKWIKLSSAADLLPDGFTSAQLTD